MKLIITNPQNLQLEVTNETDKSLLVDAAPEVGGGGEGFRPMQLVLSAIATCSSIDLLLILKKYKKPFREYKVEIQGERSQKIPKVFKSVHLDYYLKSDITSEQFERAADLALHKYCSVSAMLGEVALSYTCHLQKY